MIKISYYNRIVLLFFFFFDWHKHNCESMDGYLIEIQDQEEMDWITVKLLKAGKQVIFRYYMYLSVS